MNIKINYDRKLNTVASCTKTYAHYRDGLYVPESSMFLFRFSEHFLPVMSREELVDIVIHEVAHAVTDSRRDGSHGAVWRRNAQRMGGSGNRLHMSSEKQNEAIKKYRGTCPQGHKFYRNRKNHDIKYYCPDCTPTVGGRKVYSDVSVITWKTLR